MESLAAAATENIAIMSTLHPALERAEAFCQVSDLRIPILLAPMAGASAPSLSVAVGKVRELFRELMEGAS